MTRLHPISLTTFVFAVMLALSFSLSVEAKPSNKWRLHFNGKADRDGVYVIKMVPKHGKPEMTRIQVDRGTRENVAAREASRALKRDSKGYDIDYEDGEEVQIRARVGTPDFTVQVEDAIPGLKIRVERE